MSGAVDPETLEWWYIDRTGQEFGPFRHEKMRAWFAQGFFPIGDELLVRLRNWNRHVAVKTLYPDGQAGFFRGLPRHMVPPDDARPLAGGDSNRRDARSRSRSRGAADSWHRQQLATRGSPPRHGGPPDSHQQASQQPSHAASLYTPPSGYGSPGYLPPPSYGAPPLGAPGYGAPVPGYGPSHTGPPPPAQPGYGPPSSTGQSHGYGPPPHGYGPSPHSYPPLPGYGPPPHPGYGPPPPTAYYYPSSAYGRYYGRLKSFNPKHGFGFIDCHEARARYGRDVFIHKAQIGDLEVGEDISFTIETNKEGHPQAREILRMDGRPPGPSKLGDDRDRAGARGKGAPDRQDGDGAGRGGARKKRGGKGRKKSGQETGGKTNNVESGSVDGDEGGDRSGGEEAPS